MRPVDHQAVVLVMGNVFEAIAILPVIERAVLDLPAALRHAIERLGAYAFLGKVRQSIGLADGPVGFVLAVSHDAHRGPAKISPWIKVVRVPQLD
jgi:hypothetical protein